MNDVLTIEISNGISSSNFGGLFFGNTMHLTKGRNVSQTSRKMRSIIEEKQQVRDEGEVSTFLNRLTTEALKSFVDRKRTEALKYSEIFNLFEKLKLNNELGSDDVDQHTLLAADYFMRNYVAAFGLAAPKIKIFDDGELSFFWGDKSGAVDLTVESDETYSFYAKKKNEKKGIKGNYSINTTPPSQLLLMLK